MKYSLILISALALFSCVKERTCTCTETYSGESTNYVVTRDSTLKMKKDEAEAKCNEGDLAEQTILTETYSIECELK